MTRSVSSGTTRVVVPVVITRHTHERGNPHVSMTGDCHSMAEADGQYLPGGPGWVPGVDFDPFDAEEMEIMRLVWDREHHSALAVARAENERLRERIAELTGEEYDG